MKLTKVIITISLLVMCEAALAQRVNYSINESWRFAKTDVQGAEVVGFDDSSWMVVSVPHTWNIDDASDEYVGYYRGVGWYRRVVKIDQNVEAKRIYVLFEGANQEAELFVNGRSAGLHKGGYTAFSFDITDLVTAGDNLFAVKVDNSFNANIPPLSADFTLFGGIYRDVSLVYTSPVHISTTHYASGGVYISTPEVSVAQATVNVKTMVTNSLGNATDLVVENTILSSQGNVVSVTTTKVNVAASAANQAVLSSIKIDSPQLWDIDSPYLYKVYTRLKDTSGMELDCAVNPLGVRWYSFDPDKGFFLNGRHRKLMGTCRHQDYIGQGNALRDEMHARDVELLKAMGGNFLRVAHYPQDPVILQMCDRLGIVASVEIPVVNAVTMTKEFDSICVDMTREMVYQSFNAPSVVMWSYMNEVMLRPPYDPKNDSQKRTYMDYVYKIASHIETTLRTLDPQRYTMLPCHGNAKLYVECGISSLPMILGWNLYQGWYSDGFDGFERALDQIHAMFPKQSILVTEYGADVDPRLHSFSPERFDFSCEHGMRYHQHYIPQILKRPFVAGANIWNLNDFYSEERRDAVPNINNKGITGVDREKKDTYFLYQATLSSAPVLHIGNGSWKIRGGVADAQMVCRQRVEVYSNATQVSLSHNGVSLGSQKVENSTASFSVPFTNGVNTLEAVATLAGKTVKDFQRMDFQMVGNDLKSNKLPFTHMNIMLGSKRYFEDRKASMVWIPEQEYTPGSWGYIGGEPARCPTRYGSLPCSTIDVLGTSDDPVFQSQRRNIEAFKADVPDGEYYVYLYWAELMSNTARSGLAYNLGNDVLQSPLGDRVFNVVINGVKQLNEFNLAREVGEERAVIKKFVVRVENGRGITIDFEKVSGEAVLNAIRIYKCF